MKLDDFLIGSYILYPSGPRDQMPEIKLERVGQADDELNRLPDKWTIRQLGACLCKDGKWMLERQPSSRTKSFLEKCRFDSPEEALVVWERFVNRALEADEGAGQRDAELG